jgi:hypothetical protein
MRSAASRDLAEPQMLPVIEPFQVAFNHHAVAVIMALMTSDCVVEKMSPLPDSEQISDVRSLMPITAAACRDCAAPGAMRQAQPAGAWVRLPDNSHRSKLQAAAAVAGHRA